MTKMMIIQPSLLIKKNFQHKSNHQIHSDCCFRTKTIFNLTCETNFRLKK